jgi:UDP-N-acetylmuramoylalanine--D-glutamate ligase
MNKEIINQMKKRIVILGAGESGAGAAVLAKAKGFDVFVSDFSSIKPKYKDMLDAHGICWEEGRHTEADILNADEIIKSPGIPDKAPIIKKLKEKGTPIISEIEFAGRYTDAKMICITGSNGKTTTTMLTYHILRQAGVDAVKYNFPNSVGQSLGVSGIVTYRPADRLHINVFGSYSPDNRYSFNRSAFGVTVGYDFTDRFGMEVGAQRYYDPQRGWQTVPIVTPYYKFNKFDLGIDVGGILYEVLRSVMIDKRGGSPVIMPPGR